jgi:hypothetical protein
VKYVKAKNNVRNVRAAFIIILIYFQINHFALIVTSSVKLVEVQQFRIVYSVKTRTWKLTIQPISASVNIIMKLRMEYVIV